MFLPSCFSVPLHSAERECCRCVLSTLGPDDAYLDDSHCHSISTACSSSTQPHADISTNLLLGSGDLSQPLLSLGVNDGRKGQSESAPTITGTFRPIGCVQLADGLRQKTVNSHLAGRCGTRGCRGMPCRYE